MSSFGWLDADTEQRRQMLEVVDLFKDDGTLDELGIGAIRDSLADTMFPGTSYLHTRLRYVLFVPWLMERAGTKPTPTEMSTEFRSLEYRLITSLLAGGENVGVIGNRARGSLKRLPSAMYWSALGAWGLRQSDFSADGWFRRRHDLTHLARRTAAADDPEARVGAPGSGLDPHLPGAPADLLRSTTFALSPDEEQYLSDIIAETARGSMLSWLVHHEPATLAADVWELDNLAQAPAALRETADHARRFSVTIHGAALLYNLLLARKSERGEAVAAYEERLASWRDELDETRALADWDRDAWWATIRRRNPQLREATRSFVDRWIDLVTEDPDVARSTQAADLVGNRERQIKGGRARLVNRSALDSWSGASGVRRLDFRWTIARRHLADLYAARESA